jgi:two-component system chemotaxis response regulator CheY
MKKVLLCDDSGMVLTLLAKRIKDLGYEIVGKAKDGDEGVKCFLELRPDLMLLDVTMPNKDGRECLEAIMKQDKNAVILMVSALQDQAVIDECLKLGAKGFVNKNKLFDEAQFKNEIEPLIKQTLKVA